MSSIPPLPAPPRGPLRIAGALALLALAGLHGPSPLAAAGAGAEATVDGSLTHLAPATDAPVIVVLDAQAEPGGRLRDPEALRYRMMDVARRTQPAVIRAALGGSPSAGRVRRFWLVNAVALRADADAVARLAGTPGVAAVVRDPVVRASEAPAGGIAASPSWAMTAIGAPRAAAATGLTGHGVRVGSIDTGIDATHPDLRGRLAAWRDFVGGSRNPYDDNGHGTHTIGTMVGADGVGVAPGATVLVAKAMGADGAGFGSAIIAAAEWMADPDGDPATRDQPDVVNNSWGMGGAGVTDTWFRPMVRHWLDLGIVPVFAAGNTGPAPGSISSPADYPESLAVGAVDSAGTVAPFSARGPVVWREGGGDAGVMLAKPDLVAPGVGIVSSAPGGRRVAYSGTSMAAPHVAGAIALIRQASPGMPARAVMDLLRATASDRGVPGVDADYGYGALDVPTALARVGAPGGGGADAPAPPPAVPARPGARPAVTLAQVRRSRAIALAADARLRTIERRTRRPATLRPERRTPTTVRLLPGELLRTRGIANRTLVRTRALAQRLGVADRLPAVSVPRLRGPLALTPAAVRRTDRFAALTLRSVTTVLRASRSGRGAGPTAPGTAPGPDRGRAATRG